MVINFRANLRSGLLIQAEQLAWQLVKACIQLDPAARAQDFNKIQVMAGYMEKKNGVETLTITFRRSG